MKGNDKRTLETARSFADRVVEFSRKDLRIALAIYHTTTLHHNGAEHTLRFVRWLKHPARKVWLAITDRDELVQWMSLGGRERPLRVLATDPTRLVEFSARGDLLRFELAPQPGATEVVFTHTFRNLGSAARHAARWELCLANLENHLAGTEVAPFSLDQFRESFTKYAWEFGPKASEREKRLLLSS